MGRGWDQPVGETWLSLKGRITRWEYWLRFVLPAVVLAVLISRDPGDPTPELPYANPRGGTVLMFLVVVWLGIAPSAVEETAEEGE